jgi:hypothetical protein
MTEHFLFLDFDGVINSHRSLFKRFAEHYNVPYTEDDFSKKWWGQPDGLNPVLMKKIDEAVDSGDFGDFNLFFYNFPFDDICIKYCNQIIKENNAEICVVSSWRLGRNLEELQKILDDAGLIGKVIGKTGKSPDRGAEILDWINFYQNKYDTKINSICIIDDDHAYDIDYIFSDYTVKDINSVRHGLRKHHIKEAKIIFNKFFSLEKIKENNEGRKK